MFLACQIGYEKLILANHYTLGDQITRKFNRTKSNEPIFAKFARY